MTVLCMNTEQRSTLDPLAPHELVPETGVDLEQLFRKHYGSLVRSAQRLLDTRHLGEEAVQEAFLRFQTSGSRPAPGHELAYLRVAVMNTARSMLRRRQCAERWRPENPRYVPPIDEQCMQRDVVRELRAHCAQLPDRQREVLVLRYWVGLSVGETADRLAISPGSVKTHASRGREALRARLTSEVVS